MMLLGILCVFYLQSHLQFATAECVIKHLLKKKLTYMWLRIPILLGCASSLYHFNALSGAPNDDKKRAWRFLGPAASALALYWRV
jgi:hypothetical protein